MTRRDLHVEHNADAVVGGRQISALSRYQYDLSQPHYLTVTYRTATSKWRRRTVRIPPGVDPSGVDVTVDASSRLKWILRQANTRQWVDVTRLKLPRNLSQPTQTNS